MEDRSAQTRQNHTREDDQKQAACAVLFLCGERGRSAASAMREIQRKPISNGTQERPVRTNGKRCAAEETKKRVWREAGALYLLEFEFVGPDDHWTPNQLIER